MNITRLCLTHSRTTAVLFLAIIVFGWQSYVSMPRAYDPGFTIRRAQITTQFSGASPERVEALVTAKIEEVAKEIPELDFVSSESRTGISIVNVNIEESYTEMRPIWDSLRRKIDNIKTELPEGVIGPDVNDEFGDVFGIVIALKGTDFSYKELEEYASALKDSIKSIADASKVEIFGIQEERIYIDYSNAKLSELDVSPNQLAQILQQKNIVSPGGSMKLEGERIELEPSGNFSSVDDIAQMLVPIPGSDKIVVMKDIAKVYRDYVDPPSPLVHASGEQALSVAVSMRQGGNNIELGKEIYSVLREFVNDLPVGIEIEVVNFLPDEVNKKVSNFIANLIQAIVIVSLVMLVFLGIKTGLIVALLIPSALIFSMLVMSIFKIGLDQISLAALIISLGMLVDNGVVMSESISVKLARGEKVYNAAIESSKELWAPLLVSSLTTSAAFLPIILAESSIGEFTSSLFSVVTITLLCSWIISLTIIPLLCVWLLTANGSTEEPNKKFYAAYEKMLTKAMQNKFSTILMIVFLFLLSVQGIKLLPNIFFPPSDRSYFKAELEYPVDTDISITAQTVFEIEAFMRDKLLIDDNNREGVTGWVSYIGNSGPRFILSYSPKPASENYAVMLINTTDAKINQKIMTALDAFVYENYPDLTIKSKLIENGPAINNPLEIRVSGSDTDELLRISKNIKDKLFEHKAIKKVTDNWGDRIKKIDININPSRAIRSGVTNQDIASSLQANLKGVELTEYREGEDIIPVIFRSETPAEMNISILESLSVYQQSSGSSVPLRQVADIKINWQPAKIIRRNGIKTISIGAQMHSGFTVHKVTQELMPWLTEQEKQWPAAYSYELGGESESSSKASQAIEDKVPIAVFIILVLLVAQFNSLRKTLIILLTIPLGFIGVVIALLAGNSFFGFMTLLGIISLTGIVINNAIVLLERIKLEINKLDSDKYRAIIIAAKERLRPILLTTATTVLGLIPLYLGGGEMWEPMALTIMGGLLFSTILTLVVIPVFYTILYDIDCKKIN